MKNIEVGQKYRHYKNKDYIILAVAKHSETLDDLVIYKALYGEGLVWARPLEMFTDNASVDGQNVERFKLLENGLQ